MNELEQARLLRTLIGEVRAVREDLLAAVAEAAGQLDTITAAAQTLLERRSGEGGQDADVAVLPPRR